MILTHSGENTKTNWANQFVDFNNEDIEKVIRQDYS